MSGKVWSAEDIQAFMADRWQKERRELWRDIAKDTGWVIRKTGDEGPTAQISLDLADRMLAEFDKRFAPKGEP